jgi:hypothetical protein
MRSVRAAEPKGGTGATVAQVYQLNDRQNWRPNMPKPTHLLSYMLRSQHHLVEVESDSKELSVEQARLHLNAIHPFDWPNEITHVRVWRIRDKECPASSRLIHNAARNRSQATINAHSGASLEP